MTHYPVKFRVKFPYDLRNWRLIHETTYNHVIKESCNYVHWWPSFISHHLVKLGSHEPCKNRDTTFFIGHATIVSCDHYGWSPLLKSYYHFKSSRHDGLAEVQI